MDEERANSIFMQLVSAHQITSSDLQELIADDTALAADGLARLFVERPELLGETSLRAESEVVVDRMCILAMEDDPELSGFEAIQYLRALFVLGWRSGRQANPCVRRIVLRLPEMLASWPAPRADLVVLGFMEHVFPMPGVPRLFESWNTDPVLAAVLRESEYLSKGLDC
ncbi:hypothetical protein Pan44_47470 [Caulifigura coniformis]|uniref:Uncharacterized protein n=1 Tax=Caulifigura coniformis TaxID=2527983 RepID=A0A517SKQ0_9PLAN|nr:hypothetical protein [Caulifigura coniformis]QDT56690.1 hypothetical protein Pan44_47470 [Caulifigura coniformis]